MRTDRYRLVLWKDYTNPSNDPLFIELYDHQSDPHETRNIADLKPRTVKKLTTQFNQGWQGNLPERINKK
jgi:hypothetical protein